MCKMLKACPLWDLKFQA